MNTAKPGKAETQFSLTGDMAAILWLGFLRNRDQISEFFSHDEVPDQTWFKNDRNRWGVNFSQETLDMAHIFDIPSDMRISFSTNIFDIIFFSFYLTSFNSII